MFGFIEVGLGVAFILIGVGVSALYFNLRGHGKDEYQRGYDAGYAANNQPPL